MAVGTSPRKQHALKLFELPARYDELGAALSFFETALAPGDGRSSGAKPNDRVLDVATGTGLVARALVERYGCRVVGLDQSAPMLSRARAELAADPALAARVELAEGEAEALPFADAEFDHLTFTYLLRYVDDPAATLRELVRVVRPGGRIACLEFCVPEGVWLWPWRLYTRVGLPDARPARLAAMVRGRALPRPGIEASPAPPAGAPAGDVGGGRGRRRHRAAHEPRRGRRDLGHQWLSKRRPAFYALRPGGWRDFITLLHPPYRPRRLRYVAIGAAAAAQIHAGRLDALAAFFLAVGIGAHSLDELHRRPLGTRLSPRTLLTLAIGGLGGALAIGVAGVLVVSATLAPLVLAGGFLVLAYNLELFNSRFHTDFWFAAAWGAFPALTGWWSNALALHSAAGDSRGRRGARLLLAQRRPTPPVDAGARAAPPHRGGEQQAAARRTGRPGP